MPLMVNAVKPVSNQVKPFADMADEVDRGVPKRSEGGKICRVGKWQKVNIPGVLSDNSLGLPRKYGQVG